MAPQYFLLLISLSIFPIISFGYNANGNTLVGPKFSLFKSGYTLTELNHNMMYKEYYAPIIFKRKRKPPNKRPRPPKSHRPRLRLSPPPPMGPPTPPSNG